MEGFAISFTVVVISFIAMVFFSLLKNDKKIKEREKNQQQLDASKKMGEIIDPFQNNEPKKSNLKNKTNKAAVKSPSIQPSLRDHLHGTTSVTSIENCKLDHFSYNDRKSFNTNEANNDIIISKEELEKIIVIGEAINNPAFKRRRR